VALYAGDKRMTDLLCPNCGSDRRGILGTGVGFRYRKGSYSGMTASYVCLKCGFYYRDTKKFSYKPMQTRQLL
jgi:predicted RNA-binding Zn-ribbon protein involved in translation (DUF1610 family)